MLHPVIYLTQLLDWLSERMPAVLFFADPPDSALGEDGTNDGHRARLGLCVDSFLWVGLHAAGSSGFMKPHVCFDPE